MAWRSINNSAFAALLLFVMTGSSCRNGQAWDSHYRNGKYDLAFHEAQRDAVRGDDRAQDLLAIMYYNAQGTPRNCVEALRWWQASAIRGNSNAAFNLANRYRSGDCGTPDDDTAVRWFGVAASHGHIASLCALAALQESSDIWSSTNSLHNAAELNVVSAQRELGKRYLAGRGVPQDPVSAHSWLNLAAGRNDEEAAELRNRIQRTLTASQLELAQKMAREWAPTQGNTKPVRTACPN